MNQKCTQDELNPVAKHWFLRLYAGILRVPLDEALNCGPDTHQNGDGNIARELKKAANRLKSEGFDPETEKVDYATLASSDALADYVEITRALKTFDPGTLHSPDARKAFWINLYNALIIHTVIAYSIEKSMLELRGVFDRAAYVVGGYRYSTNDIEHGILRANRGPAYLPFKQFRSDDPRLGYALEAVDYRLHFTLNCGAQSCPPIGFYQENLLNQQLDLAARHFVNHGGVEIKRDENEIAVSQLLRWYAVDFGGNPLYRINVNIDRVLKTIAPYIDDEADRTFIIEYVDTANIRFVPYDWTLNA